MGLSSKEGAAFGVAEEPSVQRTAVGAAGRGSLPSGFVALAQAAKQAGASVESG